MTVDQAESELQNAPLAGCKYPAGVHLWLLDGEGNDRGELCPPAFRVNANNSSAGDGCQDEVIGIEIGELRQPIEIVDRVETTTAVRGGRNVSGLAQHRPPGPQAPRHVSPRLPRVPAGTHAPQNHRRLAPPLADELNSVDAKTQDRQGLRLVRPDKLRKNIPPDHGIDLHLTSTSPPGAHAGRCAAVLPQRLAVETYFAARSRTFCLQPWTLSSTDLANRTNGAPVPSYQPNVHSYSSLSVSWVHARKWIQKIGSSPEGALCRRRPPQLPDPTNCPSHRPPL